MSNFVINSLRWLPLILHVSRLKIRRVLPFWQMCSISLELSIKLSTANFCKKWQFWSTPSRSSQAHSWSQYWDISKYFNFHGTSDFLNPFTQVRPTFRYSQPFSTAFAIKSNGTSLPRKFYFNHNDWSLDIVRSLFETWPHWRTPLISNKENIFNRISSERPSKWKNDTFWCFDIFSVSWRSEIKSFWTQSIMNIRFCFHFLENNENNLAFEQ